MIYTTSYTHGGYTFSLQIYGDELEVFNHCENLGLEEPELLIANIEFEHKITTDTRIN